MKELTVLVSPTVKILVVAPPGRKKAFGIDWRVYLVFF